MSVIKYDDRTIRPKAPKLNLLDFCGIHGLTITIGRTVDNACHASIRGCEVMRNRMLESSVGFGSTESRALNELAKHISGQRLAINANCSRRELDCPTLKFRK